MEQNIDKAFIITQKPSVIDTKDKDGHTKMHILYEEVIQKNFQTIDDLLRKLSFLMTSIFSTIFRTLRIRNIILDNF